MENCYDHVEPIKNILNLDYLFQKSSWFVKNSIDNALRLCKYIEQIIQLSPTDSFVSNMNTELRIHSILKRFIVIT